MYSDIYIFISEVLFHLIVCIISVVSRNKTLYFIDPFREVKHA